MKKTKLKNQTVTFQDLGLLICVLTSFVAQTKCEMENKIINLNNTDLSLNLNANNLNYKINGTHNLQTNLQPINGTKTNKHRYKTKWRHQNKKLNTKNRRHKMDKSTINTTLSSDADKQLIFDGTHKFDGFTSKFESKDLIIDNNNSNNYGNLSDNKLNDNKYNRIVDFKVNFVVTDVLSDGEVEKRVFYNGVAAKETSVGGDSTGLKLRQLTDGRHFVQVIYTSEGSIQDCEYVAQTKNAKKFLKTFKNEIREALDEERERKEKERLLRIEEVTRREDWRNSTSLSVPEQSFRRVHFKTLAAGRELPSDLKKWFNYEKLKRQCLNKHLEMRQLVNDRESGSKTEKVVAHSAIERWRRSLRENFIVPGTKWCGAGQLATRYRELGPRSGEDRCCRAHDHCRINVPPLSTRYGVFNYRPYTVSHCRCDRRLKRSAGDLLRVPGTRWCGRGYSSTRYAQLGRYARADRCCRAHDMRCPHWIGALDTKYGLFNWRLSTLMHCRCDERFRACLKLADTSVSNMVGKLFFNVVQSKCFVLKPAKVCLRRSWWGKCIKRGYTKQAYMRNNMLY